MKTSLLSMFKTRHQGFVLPVVLVLMFAMTALVVTQIRRGTVDQQLAVNSRQYIQAEAAANTVLRWCEAWVLAGNQNNAGLLSTPANSGAAAAWRTNNNWDATTIVNGNATLNAFPNVSNYRCLYENATAELVSLGSQRDYSLEGTTAGSDPLIRKYRITARVTLNSGQNLFMQSELRFSI